MSQTETYDAEDVAQMDKDKLKKLPGDAFDVDPDELEFPFAHHTTVDAKLRALGQKGVISVDEAEDVYARHIDSE